MGERGSRATVSAGRPCGAALLRLRLPSESRSASDQKTTLLRIGWRLTRHPGTGVEQPEVPPAGTSLESAPYSR